MNNENNEVLKSMITGTRATLTKENLLEYVTNHRSFASFPEIMRQFENTSGDLYFGFLEYNIILWANISHELYDILIELINDKLIAFVQTIPLTYLVDGEICSLPIAKKAIKYKNEHWLPVTICTYNLAKTQKNFLELKLA